MLHAVRALPVVTCLHTAWCAQHSLTLDTGRSTLEAMGHLCACSRAEGSADGNETLCLHVEAMQIAAHERKHHHNLERTPGAQHACSQRRGRSTGPRGACHPIKCVVVRLLQGRAGAARCRSAKGAPQQLQHTCRLYDCCSTCQSRCIAAQHTVAQ